MNGPLAYSLPPIYQGATWRLSLTWKTGDPATAVNLTGCTARMQIRSSVTSPTELLELTTENGGITLGGVVGTIVILIEPSDTVGQAWRTGVYDLEIIFGSGDVRRLLEGSAALMPEVTRV